MAADKAIEQGTQLTPRFNSEGLTPVIAQDTKTGQVLMFAYMNKEALDETVKTGCATYYSRSRKKLWKKGETSGHTQKIKKILVDCDYDTILYLVVQKGPACHTNKHTCFHNLIK